MFIVAGIALVISAICITTFEGRYSFVSRILVYFAIGILIATNVMLLQSLKRRSRHGGTAS
jgi:hypothetical protein